MKGISSSLRLSNAEYCHAAQRARRLAICLIIIVVTAVLAAQKSGAAERQVLQGHVPTVVTESHLQPLGQLPGGTNLYLAVGLPLRNKEELKNMLREIYDPASPHYRQYLTPEQFTERFGPTEQDYQTVIDFMKANGLTVTGRHPNRTLLDVRGSVANIEKTFHLTMRVYQHPTENRTFYAPDVEPSLDLAVPL
jgi:subtilase family serine protease